MVLKCLSDMHLCHMVILTQYAGAYKVWSVIAEFNAPLVFLHQACVGRRWVQAADECRPQGCACLVSWNCFGLCISMSVCVCVCVPSRALITSGMIWYDIDRVWLVKEVLQFFPAISCFIWHLQWAAINKMDGCGLIYTARHECLPKKTKVMWY